MATIYRFIVEEGKSAKSGSRKGGGGNSKTKTGKTTSLLRMISSGNKGGVEANRKMRAINPLINKATFGYWEKATRVGRAGLGLTKWEQTDDGLKFAGLSSVAIAIIISFAIQTYLKIQNYNIQKSDKENTMNYKRMETGISSVHGQYKVDVNLWNGKITYNENK